jgi:hypothetical protein
MPHVRQRSEAVDVDHGQVVGRGLKDVALVMDLHEFAPVGGRASGRCERRRLERLAQVCQDLPNRVRLADRRSAATGGRHEREGQGWFRTRKAV